MLNVTLSEEEKVSEKNKLQLQAQIVARKFLLVLATFTFFVRNLCHDINRTTKLDIKQYNNFVSRDLFFTLFMFFKYSKGFTSRYIVSTPPFLLQR